MARTGVVGVIRGRGDSAPARSACAPTWMRCRSWKRPARRYASQNHGVMHACGHDGHTTMLLGAAKYLAETRNFDGTVYVIFQPAEENLAGGDIMVKDGLFERCPMEMVFGMHNWPQMPAGTFAWRDGPIMAAVANIEITITGKGAHGAHAAFRHRSRSWSPARSSPRCRRIVARNDRTAGRRRGHHRPHQRRPHLQRDPRDGAHAGHRALVRCRASAISWKTAFARLATGIAESFGAKADVVFSRDYPATVNDPDATDTDAPRRRDRSPAKRAWCRWRSRPWAARISRSC